MHQKKRLTTFSALLFLKFLLQALGVTVIMKKEMFVEEGNTKGLNLM